MDHEEFAVIRALPPAKARAFLEEMLAQLPDELAPTLPGLVALLLEVRGQMAEEGWGVGET